MVPVVGLEPTLLSKQDFESSASTNFTTPACLGLDRKKSEGQGLCKGFEKRPHDLRAGISGLTPETSAVPKIKETFTTCKSCNFL